MAKTKAASNTKSAAAASAAKPKVASEFEKIIQEGRERKKNEALADKIFSKGRRQSAPSKLNAPTGPSLASRVGVKKSRNSLSLAPSRSKPSRGDVNGEWTHDLHSSVNDNRNNNNNNNSLASRITSSSTAARPSRAAKQRVSRLAAAVDLMDTSPDAPQHVNVVKSKPSTGSLTIRGLAGPFSVMAQNFAPGTTAADIESAMTPVGGEMISCTIVKTMPMIIVEMVFAAREGGEWVIETFNNKNADGRLIKVYPKIGGYQPPSASAPAPSNAPNGPRASRRTENVIDGSHGFPEPRNAGGASNGRGDNHLYSDRLVGNNSNGARRGRGRGRGGR